MMGEPYSYYSFILPFFLIWWQLALGIGLFFFIWSRIIHPSTYSLLKNNGGRANV
jgi:hypothetical protein